MSNWCNGGWRPTRGHAALVAWVSAAMLLPGWASGQMSPRNPEAALNSFRLSDKQTIVELVVAEPFVTNPVDVAWDEDGAMYVLELNGYGTDRPRSRIKRLVDVDGDGSYDRGTIYAEELPAATSLLPWKEGLLVLCSGDILHLVDHDEDGLVDDQRVVLTGLDGGRPRPLTGRMTWGLDNWIYVSLAHPHARVRLPSAAPDAAVSIGPNDFRFRPDTDRIEPIAGFGRHGLALDSWGARLLATDGPVPLRHVLVERQYHRDRGRLDFPAHDLLSPIDLTRVYPALRGTSRGYLVDFYNPLIYGGDRLPAHYTDSLFVCLPDASLVHRRSLQPQGATFLAEAKETAEFLASEDPWFRPVNLATGPDGALYVVDLYRERFSSPETLVDTTVDLKGGEDRGRIWRVVPKPLLRPFVAGRGNQPPPRLPQPRLSYAMNRQLVGMLSHKNRWWRETAHRLLLDRNATEVVDDLKALASKPGSIRPRVHALWILAELDQLDDETLIAALSEPQPNLRETALRLSERIASRSDELQAAIIALQRDRHPRVRHQLALTLGNQGNREMEELLLNLANQQVDDPLVFDSFVRAAGRGPAPFIQRLVTSGFPWLQRPLPAQLELLHDLARRVGVRNRDEEIASLLGALAPRENVASAVPMTLLAGLSQGLDEVNRPLRDLLRSRPAALAEGLKLVDTFIAQSEGKAVTDALDLPERVAAVTLLGNIDPQQATPVLLKLFDPREPEALQIAAARTLASLAADAAVTKLSSSEAFNTVVRSEATAALLATPGGGKRLARLISTGDLDWFDLDPPSRVAIQMATASETGDFVNLDPVDRSEVLQTHLTNTDHASDLRQGAKLFADNCLTCHQVRGHGSRRGPDLTFVDGRSRDDLLQHVLDPQAETAPRFEVHVVVTQDDRVYSGVLREQSPAGIVLVRLDGKRIEVPGEQIARMVSTRRSWMPDDWHARFAPGEINSLLAFLANPDVSVLRSEDRPFARRPAVRLQPLPAASTGDGDARRNKAPAPRERRDFVLPPGSR